MLAGLPLADEGWEQWLPAQARHPLCLRWPFTTQAGAALPVGQLDAYRKGPADSIAKRCWGAPGQCCHTVPWTIPWVHTGTTREKRDGRGTLNVPTLPRPSLSSPQWSRLSQVQGMRAATSCALAPQGKGRGKALLLAPQTRQHWALGREGKGQTGLPRGQVAVLPLCSAGVGGRRNRAMRGKRGWHQGLGRQHGAKWGCTVAGEAGWEGNNKGGMAGPKDLEAGLQDLSSLPPIGQKPTWWKGLKLRRTISSLLKCCLYNMGKPTISRVWTSSPQPP